MLTHTPSRTLAVAQSRPSTVPSRAVTQGPFATIDLMGSQMTFGANEEIFGEGEPTEFAYKVTSGAVRTYKILSDGRRQIGGFYFPGDIFGLEFGGGHQFSAEAINAATVRVVRRSAILSSAERDCEAARELWTHTAGELRRVQEHMMLLIKTAQQRVACFLLEISERLSTSDAVELPMSRQDIADYLGLTIETVSRTMTQLSVDAAIGLPTSRRVVLRNRGALRRLNA